MSLSHRRPDVPENLLQLGNPAEYLADPPPDRWGRELFLAALAPADVFARRLFGLPARAVPPDQLAAALAREAEEGAR